MIAIFIFSTITRVALGQSNPEIVANYQVNSPAYKHSIHKFEIIAYPNGPGDHNQSQYIFEKVPSAEQKKQAYLHNHSESEYRDSIQKFIHENILGRSEEYFAQQRRSEQEHTFVFNLSNFQYTSKDSSWEGLETLKFLTYENNETLAHLDNSTKYAALVPFANRTAEEWGELGMDLVENTKVGIDIFEVPANQNTMMISTKFALKKIIIPLFTDQFKQFQDFL